ncbi:hypothetical protein [Streptomyces sp. NPDC005438]|uniref:hypothetical protein n=1 Tax=Streptomyces sp. NPDC005438 TaxID=3156880 RepID=UPI0033B560C5
MQGRNRRVTAAVGAALLVPAVAWGAYSFSGDGTDHGSPAPPSTSASTPKDSATTQLRAEGRQLVTLRLPGGRRVEMRHVNGRGLQERHYDPDTGKWSQATLLYRTRTEACPDITLTASHGTVAAIADFGRFCDDGEPPEESVAAIGTGDLSHWTKHLKKRFDGWTKVKITGEGARARFRQYGDQQVTTLEWSRSGGFGTPTESRRVKQLDERYFGSWKSRDGSQRVAVQRRGHHGVATFFRQKGPRCVVRVGLFTQASREGEFRGVYRQAGERSRSCPFQDFWDRMKLNKAGTRLSFDALPLTFTRVEPNEEERKLPTPPPAVFSLDRDWLGTWRLRDGDERLTVKESTPDSPFAVLTRTGGQRCVARVPLYARNSATTDKVASKPVRVVEGKASEECRPKDVTLTLARDGKSLTRSTPGQPRKVYLRD